MENFKLFFGVKTQQKNPPRIFYSKNGRFWGLKRRVFFRYRRTPRPRPMLAMPSPTASSLAATMPNLSRSGRRAVKRRSPGGLGAQPAERSGAFVVIFFCLCWKKGGWIPKNSCGVLEVRSIFCVFFQWFFYLLRFFWVFWYEMVWCFTGARKLPKARCMGGWLGRVWWDESTQKIETLVWMSLWHSKVHLNAFVKRWVWRWLNHENPTVFPVSIDLKGQIYFLTRCRNTNWYIVIAE